MSSPLRGTSRGYSWSMRPAPSKRTDSPAAVHNREVTSLDYHFKPTVLSKVTSSCCSVKPVALCGVTSPQNWLKPMLIAAQSWEKSFAKTFLETLWGEQQLAGLGFKYQKVVTPVKQKIMWHLPPSYKNRSPLIIRIHCTIYLKGEKSLHFSSCKYVREKVNLFPTLRTAQLCLSKSKHMTFFAEENVESHLISASLRLCLYDSAFKQVTLSSLWSQNQGSQIHVYPLQLSSSLSLKVSPGPPL